MLLNPFSPPLSQVTPVVLTAAKTWSRPSVKWGGTPYDLVKGYRSYKRILFSGFMQAFQRDVDKFLPDCVAQAITCHLNKATTL